MDNRLKNEVKNLMKLGLPEDFAILAAGAKLGDENAVNTVLNDLYDEQTELQNSLSHLVPMMPIALEDTQGEVIIPDASKAIFVEINSITNETKPIEIPNTKPDEESIEQEQNEVIQIASSYKPAHLKMRQ